MRILVIGQCTLHWGRMEFGNLGNYAIIQPFVQELHRVFPNAEIRTTFQMSDEFCKREKVTKLPMELYYSWGSQNLLKNIYELLCGGIYRFLNLRADQTEYMKEVFESDLVIDFSGDIWGDNADLVGKRRFVVGACKDLTAHLLGKPIVMVAGSPGPFKNLFHRWIAKFVLRRFDKVTVREPLSLEILRKQHFSLDKTVSLACPAFLFKTPTDDQMKEIYERENLNHSSRPTVGFVLCGWNMPKGPYGRWPRDDDEYQVFANAIEFMTRRIGVRVCLLSHNNGFTQPPDFRIIPGRDHQILDQLMKVLAARGRTKDFFTIKGLYDCGQTKAIIRKFDMLVSGRIHAAVSGLSQYVPTVIIDYGHEPKAHKLRGFAEVAGVSEYVADPSNSDEMIYRINECWKNKEVIRQHLRNRIPEVQALARMNFNLLPSVLLENPMSTPDKAMRECLS